MRPPDGPVHPVSFMPAGDAPARLLCVKHTLFLICVPCVAFTLIGRIKRFSTDSRKLLMRRFLTLPAPRRSQHSVATTGTLHLATISSRRTRQDGSWRSLRMLIQTRKWSSCNATLMPGIGVSTRPSCNTFPLSRYSTGSSRLGSYRQLGAGMYRKAGFGKIRVAEL